MGIIRATTTISAATITDSDGNTVDVSIDIVADPSEYRFDDDGYGSPCFLYIFVNPMTYLSTAYVATPLCTDSTASISYKGLVEYPIADEDLALAAENTDNNEDVVAVGTTARPIYSDFTCSEYGGIGGTTYDIIAQKTGASGTNQIKTTQPCRLAYGKASYTSRAMKYEIKNMTKDKVGIEASLTY